MKRKDYIEKLLEVGTVIAFFGLVLNVSYQILTRSILPQFSVVWTEEASRFLFIYSVVFSAPLAMKKREYVNVDILISYLPRKARIILEVFSNIVSTGLFLLVFIQSLQFARLGIGQTSPALQIPMVIAYSSISITSFFITLYGVWNLIQDIRGQENRGDLL